MDKIRTTHHFRTRLGQWFELLKVPNGNPALTAAQFEAFSKQVPLLYFILATNMISLAWTHQGTAPDYLVIYLPSFFIALFVLRSLIWLRGRKRQRTAEQAYRQLKATNLLSLPIAVFCTGWSLSLLPYGDAYQQAHVAFFMAITVIGCIFCLMHLRSAALIVTVTVNLPFFVVMCLSGHPTFIATGVNVILVTMAMIMILVSHYRDFRQLHESRNVLMLQQQALQEQNKAMQVLSDENLRLANLDSLTQLANRRSFFAMLETAFARESSTDGKLAVGVIDLDGFKPVNDLYGHSAGDKVLIEISNRLSTITDPRLSVYRLGGDEFGLLLQGDVTEDSANALGAKVCELIAERINIGSGMVQVTGSVGFAIYPDVGETGQEIYELADYALYTAKRHHRAGTVIFNAVQANELNRQKVVEEAMVAADLDKELSLVFQPITCVDRRICIGFEALARWQSPRIGQVSPAEFIPVAEHNGRITLITRMLLARALKTATLWPDDIYLSFNLSPHDLTSPENILKIVAIVLKSGFDPRRINFEITETAVMHDFEQASASIQMLRELGAGISLDDFGTGYSSLNHVHKLPLTKIKIDGSFVRNIHTRKASFNIVKSVLAMCAEMELEAIVEGVETEEELHILENLGVRAVQGYYFGKPMTADDTLKRLALQDTKALAS
ncbi:MULTISPECIES: putative bifunctional diguanylate cyclase/phosphodiesterase [Rhizobium]|uniref:putative bifunctional diguanylate cyclase/phosphodiesterase n=1 Tax=Rhizobium TaxID=379 RepID=UPI001FDF1A5E|nr:MULTISPECIES: EAL domain-containing protein [Rhizobium]